MSFTSPAPRDNTWGDAEVMVFLREIYRRFGTSGTFTWDPPSVAANSTLDTTLTDATVPGLTGMRVGMSVTVTPPSSLDAGLTVTGWCGASGSLTIRLSNLTAGAIDPASAVWTYAGVIV